MMIIVPKTTFSQGVLYEKTILDYKIDTGVRLKTGLVRKLTHGQIEKDIVQWVYDNFDTIGSSSGNFATTDLTLTANRLHSFDKKSMDWAYVNSFILKDTTNTSSFSVVNGVTYIRNWSLPQSASTAEHYLTVVSPGTTQFQSISKLGLITKYNGSTVVGNGVGAIRAKFDAVGVTSGGILIGYSSPANQNYVYSVYVNINSVTTNTLKVQLRWTDFNSVSHTEDLIPLNNGGSAILSTVKYYIYPSAELRVLSGTNIEIEVIDVVTGGSIDFDNGATLTQIN